MTFEAALAFALLLGALIVFALDVFRIDFVAFAILALVLVLGPVLKVKPEEAISGFSNPATITVMAMFILSGGIYRTGMINVLGRRMTALAGDGELRQLITVILIVGPISMFINNTAAVAILIPTVLGLGRKQGRPASKLLMPLSFASQLGGVVTLIGTSTNVLASSLSADRGYGAFSMFEFAGIGLLVFITGSLYILFIGRRLIPERRQELEVGEAYKIKEYLSEVVVMENSPLVGMTLAESRLSEHFGIQVLEITREGKKMGFLLADRLQARDVLFVQADRDQLLRVKDIEGLEIEPDEHFGSEILKGAEMGLLEVVIGPNSDLISGTLQTTDFRKQYDCIVIAIQRHGHLIRERLGNVRLGFGDTLLLRGPAFALEKLKRDPNFIVTEQVPVEEFRTEKIPVALAIVAAVVIVAALGVPILITSIVGCVLMRLTGCLKMNELHEAIRWDVLLVLAGLIPLGLALEHTGGAQLLADLAARLAQYVSPLVVVGIFYAMTMVLTELISNNAAVVVMVPVGGAVAQAIGLDPKALVLAIMFAASTSFSTPVGYQTNTMIYGPGGYKFLDFLRVGGPLNLLLAIVTPVYIYLFWGI